jgi:polyvinyl alcohol dehydrogenase (cytochrome)
VSRALTCMVVAAAGLAALAPTASSAGGASAVHTAKKHSKPRALRVRLVALSRARATRTGRVRVRVRARRRGRVRIVLRVRSRRKGVRVTRAAKRRTVRLPAGRTRTLTLRLTRRARRLLRSCVTVRLSVAAGRVRRPRARARSSRRYRPGRLCGAAAQPDGFNGDWPQWSFDLSGSRYNPAERTLTARNAGRLELKWAFAVPNTDGAQSSQPAVVGNTVYVGGRNGIFYALDALTGKERWEFDTRVVVGEKVPNPGLFPDPSASSGTNPLRDGPAVANGLVYFGDFNGYLYALDARTGRLRWATKLDSYVQAIVTGSPLYYRGVVYVGVSSNEVFTSSSPTYECCRARGSMVALDAATGKIRWKYYTVPEPKPAGRNSFGAQRYEPSGVSVWNTPAIDPASGRLHFGTSQNYTGETDHADAMIALDSASGTERWHHQLTQKDKWTAQCLFPVPGGNCPDPGPDFDFGSSANLFKVGKRRLVGQGQKSGVYHVLDARTGQIVWQTILNRASGKGGAGGQEGIQWGTAYDGERIYASTNQANPGTLFALDPASGRALWRAPNPANGCSSGGANAAKPGDCSLALPAAASVTPGVVWEGSRDGKMRAYSADRGHVLWEYDTARPFTGTNGLPGKGGSISGAGAAISRGMVYVNSGYQTANSPFTGISGNVLLAFGLPGR